MYIDKLENLSNYIKDQKLAKAITEFLLNSANVEAGKHPILDGTFANVLEYTTKPFEAVKMEAHRKYLDLQYVVCGEEAVLKQDLADNQPINEYNEVKDVVHYSPKAFDKALLLEGTFGIMFPEDLHQCIAVTAPAPIKKVVVKIPVGII
ncbi:MAG: YhcH/YjgK/YiaL family protein [Clostridia bacterium]|nr:YhcH/YjgK/YiaL family protein [Clostridia bacterium]